MKQNARTTVVALIALVVSLGGCVLNEKYENEKGRALNFQRLLAQEDKRTGELDTDLKRVKRESSELEARNRELAAQLQAVREQLGRVQEETAGLREAAALREQQDRSRAGRGHRQEKGVGPRASSSSKVAPPGPSEGGDSLQGRSFQGGLDVKADSGVPRYHEVKPGETLFRLGKQYGVNVETIRHWNHLQDDVIEIGQKLVVGYE
jgi:hypothetical protein